jgi:hypothetical protein
LPLPDSLFVHSPRENLTRRPARVISRQRLAAVDVQRLARQKAAGHREQDRAGNVVGGPDPPDRIAGADIGEVVGLALVAEGIPGASVDDAGEMAFTRIGASSRARERANVSAAALVIATAMVPTVIFVAATPEQMTSEPPSVIRGAKCLASIRGPITLVSNDSRTASRPRSAMRPRARAEPSAEAGDRVIVGEVDIVSADAWLADVRGLKDLRIAACRHHAGSLVTRGERDGPGEPAAAPDDQHGLVLQESGHDKVLSRNCWM